MSNISICSNLYCTDENGKEHSLLKLYAYGKCVWKKEEAGVWLFVVEVTSGTSISINMTHSYDDIFDWGDGTTSVNGNINSHRYTDAGTYTIKFVDKKRKNLWYGTGVTPAKYLKKIVQPACCTKIYIYALGSGDIDIEYTQPSKITTVQEVYCGIVDMDIPNGVTSIEDNAFYYKYAPEIVKLKKITFPNTLKTIGSYAFYGLTGLSDVSLPDSVTRLGASTFNGTKALKSIRLSENLTLIPSGCFANSGLEHISFPASVASIDSSAFQNCYSLKEVNIPDTVTNVGPYAFYDTQWVSNIRLSNNLKNIREYSFYGCGSISNTIKNLVIPDSVTRIYEFAFYGISKIQTLTLSKNLKILNKCAFYNSCSNVSEINFPDTLDGVGPSVFVNNGFKTLKIPPNFTSIDDEAFYRSTKLTELVFEGSVSDSPLEISSGAFKSSQSLTSITINRPIKSIGEQAFAPVTIGHSMTISFNAPVTEIGIGAFAQTQIKNLEFPEGLTLIQNSAFSGNDALNNLVLPNTVERIEKWAFSGAWDLEEIDIPASVVYIGVQAFCYDSTKDKECKLKKIIVRGNPVLDENCLGFTSDNNSQINCTFYGIAGSNTETYAKDNGFDFVAI